VRSDPAIRFKDLTVRLISMIEKGKAIEQLLQNLSKEVNAKLQSGHSEAWQ